MHLARNHLGRNTAKPETDTRAELNSCQFLVTRLQDHQIRSVHTEASGKDLSLS
jgi:hypothetical protein